MHQPLEFTPIIVIYLVAALGAVVIGVDRPPLFPDLRNASTQGQ
jgi:hypothetical protein